MTLFWHSKFLATPETLFFSLELVFDRVCYVCLSVLTHLLYVQKVLGSSLSGNRILNGASHLAALVAKTHTAN